LNISMTCTRPPQQGQGLGSVRGSSVRAAAAGSGLGGDGGHLNNSRAAALKLQNADRAAASAMR
jgi:hypothetical protein